MEVYKLEHLLGPHERMVAGLDQAGSVLSLGPAVQYAAEKTDPIELRVSQVLMRRLHSMKMKGRTID